MARTVVQPLSSTKGATEISNKHEEVVEWDGQKSVRTFHVFVNETQTPVDLYWFHGKTESHHGTIQPGSNVYVGTYTFNQWKVKSTTGKLLAVHAGQSATISVRDQGCTIEFNIATADADDRDKCSMQTPKGRYAIRSHALNMPVWAFDCVPDQAVERAVHVVTCMLQGCSPAILQAMMAHRPALAVFGRDHVVSDVPPHSFMRFNVDRNLNDTSRGLGGTPTVPVTSCAEENLTMEEDKLYPCQSILVHELGHAVQNLGMDLQTKTRVQAAYSAAVSEGLYQEGCYMVVNDHEYWATGTEAWFESTIREDVNGGVNTREKARRHDPRLAAVLAEVYGDGQWRYHHDCPHPLSFHQRQPAVATQPALEPASVPSISEPSSGHPTLEPSSVPGTAQPHARSGQPSTGGSATATTTTTATTNKRLIARTSAGNAPASATTAMGESNPRRSAAGGDVLFTSKSDGSAGSMGRGGRGCGSGGGGCGGDDVQLSAPEPVAGIHHAHSEPGPAQGQGVAGGPLDRSTGKRASSSGGWCFGGCHWSNPLTAFCPGTRMYPSDGTEEAGADGTGEPDLEEDGFEGGGNGTASQQQGHSVEVIAILSGGADLEAAGAGAGFRRSGRGHGCGGARKGWGRVCRRCLRLVCKGGRRRPRGVRRVCDHPGGPAA